MTRAQEKRRTSAAKRLELQLNRGTKTEKKTGNQLPLSDKDRTRIERELATLKKNA